MSKQVNPMPAFIRTGFDCQFSGVTHFLNSLYSNLNGVIHDKSGAAKLYVASTTLVHWDYCRPRLDEPKVLPCWDWLDNPLLVGVLWSGKLSKGVYGMTHYLYNINKAPTVELIELLDKDKDLNISQLQFMGAQQGSQLECWAEANYVPIYSDDMEVVK